MREEPGHPEVPEEPEPRLLTLFGVAQMNTHSLGFPIALGRAIFPTSHQIGQVDNGDGKQGRGGTLPPGEQHTKGMRALVV